MKAYVIDASVAVKWFYQEPFREESKRYLASTAPLYAPEIIRQEFANTLVKKIRHSDLLPDQGWQSYEDLFQTNILELISSHDYIHRSYQMAIDLKHSVYDCLYLAVAEKMHATVVTADRKFFDQVHKNKDYQKLIRWIEDTPEA